MTIFHTKPAIKVTTIIIFVCFLSISTVFFYYQQDQQNIIYGKTNELATMPTLENDANIQSLNAKQGFPVHLEIPSIGVDADVQHVGFNSEGEMDVPDNINTLGWFAFGPRPGEKGSAVIAGHLYGENSKPGVFANLSNVQEGDKIYIKDSKGNFMIFIVKEQRVYDPGFALDVFNRTDKQYLNLVTCDGNWDMTKESYTKRLIVFAEIAP